jgi:hypothetical protein
MIADLKQVSSPAEELKLTNFDTNKGRRRNPSKLRPMFECQQPGRMRLDSDPRLKAGLLETGLILKTSFGLSTRNLVTT